jgi:hypothetical protein
MGVTSPRGGSASGIVPLHGNFREPRSYSDTLAMSTHAFRMAAVGYPSEMNGVCGAAEPVTGPCTIDSRRSQADGLDTGAGPNDHRKL